MRSFTLAAFASLAFGIFCSAAPTPSGLPPVNVVVRDTPVSPPAQGATLQSVLTVATTSLKPLADKVYGLKTVEAVESDLTLVLQEVVVVLNCAIDGVKGLAGLPIDQILATTTNGVELDVGGIVDLVSTLLIAVLSLLQGVLSLVTGTVKENVVPLVDEITGLLAELLSAILELVGNLATEVLTGVLELIGNLIPFIIDLNVRQLLIALNLSS